MPKQHEPYRVYRALLHLYPKAHRQEYGQQMVQTLDDMLADISDSLDRLAVWVRVGAELPLSIIQENLNTVGATSMSKLIKVSNKRLVISLTIIVVAVISTVVALGLHGKALLPDTLAQAKATRSHTCLSIKNDPTVKVDSQNQTFIVNSAVNQLINVPAGTNVNVYFKTYSANTATGTSIYSGTFGSYNFTAQKVAENSTNSYTGGWKIISFNRCIPAS